MAQILFVKILMRFNAVFEARKKKRPENVIMQDQVLPLCYRIGVKYKRPGKLVIQLEARYSTLKLLDTKFCQI